MFLGRWINRKQVRKTELRSSKMRPRRLKNEALRPPKAPRVASWAAKGPLGALRGGFGVVSRRPRGSKKRGTRKMEIDITLFWGSFWHRFGNFLLKKAHRSANDEMLENDDPYSTLAMFSRPRGLQNEVKMRPKR